MNAWVCGLVNRHGITIEAKSQSFIFIHHKGSIINIEKPQATIVDNMPSAPVSTEVDVLHTSEIYHRLHSNGLWETTLCGVLSKNYSAAKELTKTKEIKLN